MKKYINWNEIYEDSLSKLDLNYIESKSYKSDIDYLNPIKQDKDEFLKNTKRLFFEKIKISIYNAITGLQKKIPLLAEYIILYCYDKKKLSKNEFSKIFMHTYINAKKDKTLFGTEISYNKILEIFRYCNKNIMMSQSDKYFLKNLPEEIEIYRGIACQNADVKSQGISWTLSCKKASEFAKYNKEFYGANYCIIISGIILKKNIIIYIHDSGRYESEIIINPQEIFNVERCIF